jgi:polysaccharide chain length determinant protein (PEP-CTERM system associated)
MQDFIHLALSYLIGVWRYRWMILVVPTLVSPVGWFYVATLPDVYNASARVYVDTDSVLNPLMQGLAVRIDDSRRLSMMTKLLFTRETMEKLARMTDQDLKAKTPRDMERIASDLKDRIKLKGRGRNIYDLAFDDESPDLAKRVVQSFLTIFVETNLGESRKDQDSAEQFILREAKDYERRLVDAERKLKEFKARNLDYLKAGGSYYEQLQQARTALDSAKLDLQVAEERRDEMQDQLVDLETDEQSLSMMAEGVGASSPLQSRIDEMQSQVDDLLIRYTERHPEVIALRRSIAALRQREAERQQGGDESADDTFADNRNLNENPVYQQMRLLVTESEAEVASRQAVVKEYERRIAALETGVDRVLEIEAEQKQLNRDYNIVRGKHQKMLERLEALRLGREVDNTADTVRFRIIEPPKVTDEPVGPDRILLSSTVFGGGLAGGLALALVISLLRPTFSSRKDLGEATGVPVLGSVEMVWTDQQQRRRRRSNLLFAASFTTLLLLFGAVLLVYQLDIAVLSRLPLL